jgi:hypothetical protein
MMNKKFKGFYMQNQAGLLEGISGAPFINSSYIRQNSPVHKSSFSIFAMSL